MAQECPVVLLVVVVVVYLSQRARCSLPGMPPPSSLLPSVRRPMWPGVHVNHFKEIKEKNVLVYLVFSYSSVLGSRFMLGYL